MNFSIVAVALSLLTLLANVALVIMNQAALGEARKIGEEAIRRADNAKEELETLKKLTTSVEKLAGVLKEKAEADGKTDDVSENSEEE